MATRGTIKKRKKKKRPKDAHVSPNSDPNAEKRNGQTMPTQKNTSKNDGDYYMSGVSLTKLLFRKNLPKRAYVATTGFFSRREKTHLRGTETNGRP